jgi:hypothetical protein
MTKYEIAEGGIWEEAGWEILVDYVLSEYDERCQHVVGGKLRFVAKLLNEGGFNSTGLCLECAVKALDAVGGLSLPR